MSPPNADRKNWLISQAELEAWLDRISRVRTLIAPRQESGMILYRQVKKSAEIAWYGQDSNSAHSRRPVLSVKEVFFPPTERLFTIQKKGQEIHLEETFPDWETVVFGVRPCDARGVIFLDSLFLDTNPVDSFYARRRENTTLIGMACKELGPTCFCTSVGGAPDESHNVDIMLYEEDGGYLVEAVTEKGCVLIPANDWKEVTASRQKSDLRAQFTVTEKNNWPQHFNDDYWTGLSERCLSCRACAYVCPTCRCFAIRDEAIGNGKSARIRCWDACAGENYRRMAGGHRSRAEKKERFRNRFFCKFYFYPEQYGLGSASACTGCGRCIDVCPAGVDITEVLQSLGKPA